MVEVYFRSVSTGLLGFRDSMFLGFRDSGYPGFRNSSEKNKNLEFKGIPRIPQKKVADSTCILGKKMSDSNWDSGSQLGKCTPMQKSNISFES